MMSSEQRHHRVMFGKDRSIFGISTPGLLSQLLLGLVNGSFYAILSLGLATRYCRPWTVEPPT
jgi:hypothetical protein